MDVYTILIQSDEHGVELLPHCFTTHDDALAAVKKKYNGKEDARGKYFPNWADEGNTVVTHAEAHNSDGTLASDLILTKLYIEKGNHISIHKLKLSEDISRAAGGGNTRRRHRKRNTKNSRKHKFRLSRFY